MDNPSSVKRSRELWVDLLKALAMFLVVLGHASKNELFLTLTSPIKMPLFYIMSGYVVNFNKSTRQFFKDTFYRLGIPSLIFSLLPLYIIKYAIKGDFLGLFDYCKDFFLGYKFWFIPSFIVSQIVIFYLYKFLSKKAAFLGLACAVSFALGILLRDVKILDIWKSNTALTGVFFLFIGILLREYKNVWLSIVKSKVCLVISAIAYFGISILVYPAQSMDFHNAEYDNLLLCIFLIILGTIFCICLALAISELSPLKPIITFGQNTLVVYLLHFIIVGEIKNILNHFSIDMSFGLSLIVAVATCTIGTIISLISDRFCPILIGKRKN